MRTRPPSRAHSIMRLSLTVLLAATLTPTPTTSSLWGSSSTADPPHTWGPPAAPPHADVSSFAVPREASGSASVRDGATGVACTFAFDTRERSRAGAEELGREKAERARREAQDASRGAGGGGGKLTVEAFLALAEDGRACVKHYQDRWTYELCLDKSGGKMRQYVGDGAEEDFSLGVYDSRDAEGRAALVYAGGDRCGAKPRSTLVVFRCDASLAAGAAAAGGSDPQGDTVVKGMKLVAVTEPSQCVYRAVVNSADACRADVPKDNMEDTVNEGGAGAGAARGGAAAAPDRNAPERWVVEVSRLEGGGVVCSAKNAEQRAAEKGSRTVFSEWSLSLSCASGSDSKLCKVTGFKAVDSDGAQAGKPSGKGMVKGSGKLELALVRAGNK